MSWLCIPQSSAAKRPSVLQNGHRCCKTAIIGAAVAVLALLAGTARAATETANLTVQFDMQATCTITGATLTFATLTGALINDVEASTSFTVDCSPGITYQVGMGNGLHYANNIRNMQSQAGDNVPYRLFRDTNRSTAWGDTFGLPAAGGTVFSGSAGVAGGASSITVYGRIPGGGPAGPTGTTTPPAGTYTDTVVMTLIY